MYCSNVKLKKFVFSLLLLFSSTAFSETPGQWIVDSYAPADVRALDNGVLAKRKLYIKESPTGQFYVWVDSGRFFAAPATIKPDFIVNLLVDPKQVVMDLPEQSNLIPSPRLFRPVDAIPADYEFADFAFAVLEKLPADQIWLNSMDRLMKHFQLTPGKRHSKLPFIALLSTKANLSDHVEALQMVEQAAREVSLEPRPEWEARYLMNILTLQKPYMSSSPALKQVLNILAHPNIKSFENTPIYAEFYRDLATLLADTLMGPACEKLVGENPVG